jgi:hypothetical protein
MPPQTFGASDTGKKSSQTDFSSNSSGLLKNVRGRIIAEKSAVTCVKQS